MQENIHIPGSWKEVKLREGKQLMLISSQSGVTESALLSGSYSILTGKDFNELSLTEAAKVKEQILQLFNSKVDEQALTNLIEVDGEEFWLEYDLSRVCYGAKANAYDRLSKAEGNYWQIIEYIMASLFGEKVESNITIKEKKSWFNRKPKVEILNYELKPISTDFEFEQRAKKLLGMDMNSVLGSLLFFFSYRNEILNNFQFIFPSKARTIDGARLQGYYQEFNSNYGWKELTAMLTGNDITKKREVYKLPFLECLDELNRIIWKAEIENKILKDS